MLQIVFHFQGKEYPYEGYYREYVSKDHAELVHPAKDEAVIQDVDDPILAFGHVKKGYEGENGQEQHICGLEPPPYKRDK